MRIDSILKIVLTFMLILSCSDKSSNKIQNELCAVRSNISLIPPSPITKQILLDIRGGIWNNLEEDERFEISVYVDNVDDKFLIYKDSYVIPAHGNKGFKFMFDVDSFVGNHNIIMVTKFKDKCQTKIEPIEVVDSSIRSTKKIDGAWFEFYHWCENEGRLWNEDIIKLTDNQWKQLVKGMHDIDMNIMVIQELFRCQAYVDEHKMDSLGYKGIPYYPSSLYPIGDNDTLLSQVNNGKSSPIYNKYTKLQANDAVKAVLEEAERRNMKVFLGVGSYAWFDFSSGALKWSKEVAKELWEKYGHYKSFYGWYISAEIAGNLGKDKLHRENIVSFFRGFSEFVREMAPEKPIMLATNCHSIKEAEDYYPKLLQYLDIICPFGFHRMPENDYSGDEAAKILQKYCDDSGCHLWMDLELFNFRNDGALYPRSINEIVKDLDVYDNFEKICCYSYTGLLNAGWQEVCPGGDSTVDLYNDYMRYLINYKQ